LEITRKQLEQAHVISDPRKLHVIFGVPSELGKPYNDRLSEVAELAGYGRIQTKDEPIGALLYHISNKTLSARDAHRGILVVDFGGGTCDFAYMQSLRVCHSWGQPLGGRFFDDIFFQWFLEENPESLPIMKESRAEGFVHWFECRQVKESFSRKMASDKGQTVRSRIGNYGFLQGLTWDSFLRRSESYQPTKSFLDYLCRTGEDSKKMIERNKRINLIEWFQNSLAEGLKDGNIDKSDISRVILTGGSSQWLFVEEILSETLHIDSSYLLRSDSPYAAISMGLAILPALQNDFQEKKAKLSQDKKIFVEDEIKTSLNTMVSEIASSVAEEVTVHLYDEKIKKVLTEFQEHGGTISSVKKKISLEVTSAKPVIKEIAERNARQLDRGLPSLIQEKICQWFEGYDLHYDPENVRIKKHKALGQLKFDSSDLYDDMTETITSIISIVVTAIVAMICGGGGMALIWTGPIGLIIGAIIGLLAVGVGIDAAKERIENTNLPQTVVRILLTKKKLNKLLLENRSKFKEDIRLKVIEQFEEPMDDLLNKVEARIDKEVECIDAIDQL
jgi:molecular chaperone DnaK (HSP70)